MIHFPLAFDVTVHNRILNSSLDGRGYSKDAIKLLHKTQREADDNYAGGRGTSYYWIHYIEHIFGMDPTSCARIKGVLGKKRGEVCSMDEAYQAAERIIFKRMKGLIDKKEGDKLDNETKGKILFLLGLLAHSTQDKKHSEGWRGDINVLEHYLPPKFFPGKNQQETDTNPPSDMEGRAMDRTKALFDRYEKFLMGVYGNGEGRDVIRQVQSFKLPPNKKIKDYFDSSLVPQFFLDQSHIDILF
jgi:hypothetical protein